jgi:hypothetical protein
VTYGGSGNTGNTTISGQKQPTQSTLISQFLSCPIQTEDTQETNYSKNKIPSRGHNRQKDDNK